MNTKLTNENDKITFHRIRKAIGVLGFGLPIVLLILPLFPFFDTSTQHSISHYYYTNLRELFTGTLCATGLFLIRYQGHENSKFWKNDSLLTNIAGIAAFGVAFLPTSPDYCCQKIYTLFPSCHVIIGYIHYFFAASFFLVLSIVSINVFTIGQEENKNIPISLLNENNIYRVCGYLMLVFILLIPVCSFFEVPYATLIFEALALFSFGTSWLIKGRALGDKGNLGKMVYRESH